jgi:GNAT superfamily N-acetyltransferase
MANEPELVPVGTADLAVLEPMVRDFYAEEGLAFGPQQALALAELVNGCSRGVAWFVRLAGETVGYVLLTFGFSVEAGGRDGLVDEFFLLPAVRNRGVGGQVLALIERKARGRGLRRIWLEVNHGNPARSLYQRTGFVDHGRHLMSKPL